MVRTTPPNSAGGVAACDKMKRLPLHPVPVPGLRSPVHCWPCSEMAQNSPASLVDNARPSACDEKHTPSHLHPQWDSRAPELSPTHMGPLGPHGPGLRSRSVHIPGEAMETLGGKGLATVIQPELQSMARTQVSLTQARA